jgi:integrase
MKWYQNLVPISLRPDSTRPRKIKTDGDNTALKATIHLSAILSYYIDDAELDAVNPCLNWPKEKWAERSLPKGRGQFKKAEPEFMSKLGTAILNVGTEYSQMLGDCILIVLMTGARRSEIELAEKSWFNFTTSYSRINLPPGFAKNDKKDKKGQTIYIGPFCKMLISPYVTNCKKKNELIFKTPNNGKHGISTRRAMNFIRKKSGDPTLTVHDLRHLFSSACIDCDIEGEVRETLLRHNVIQTNRLRYGGSSEKTLQDAVNKVEQHLRDLLASTIS